MQPVDDVERELVEALLRACPGVIAQQDELRQLEDVQTASLKKAIDR